MLPPPLLNLLGVVIMLRGYQEGRLDVAVQAAVGATYCDVVWTPKSVWVPRPPHMALGDGIRRNIKTVDPAEDSRCEVRTAL
jgi:hypothetical protein